MVFIAVGSRRGSTTNLLCLPINPSDAAVTYTDDVFAPSVNRFGTALVSLVIASIPSYLRRMNRATSRWSPPIRTTGYTAFLAVCFACAPSNRSSPSPSAPSANSANRNFETLVDSYIEWYLSDQPTHATYLGLHQHDDASVDFSAAAYASREEALTRFLTQLGAIDRNQLQGDSYYDHRILEYRLHAQRLAINEIRAWRKDPRVYSRGALVGVAPLVDRRFAPLPTRLKSITARLRKFPEIFAAARQNLTDVPPLWVKLASNSTQGAVTYLETSLIQALKDEGFEQLEPSAREPFEKARQVALEATRNYLEWMTSELAKTANGDFRLGKKLFQKKLRFDEHVDLTCEQLRDQNESAIVFYKNWVERTAKHIDSSATTEAVMASITEDFPPPDKLISTATKLVSDAQTFVKKKNIIALPTELLPTVRPTPAYRRLSFGSMSSPGPFETKATEAYYNITNVDPSWDAERQKQHM
ncbi:MAG: DUF885 family protein, partial [Myxococcota bacterium]